MLKKIAALALCALIATTSVTATAQEIYTAEVINEYDAATYEWNGKTKLQPNRSYTVSGEVKVQGNHTIPDSSRITVLKGARFVIDKGSSLTVDGRLNISSGSSVSVFGKLKLNSGKRLTSGGNLQFGSSSTIVLDGIFAVNNGSTLQGEPKSFSTSDDSTLKIYGKNFCKKLDAVVQDRELAKMFSDLYSAAIVDNDLYNAVKTVLPVKVVNDVDAVFAAEGSSLEKFCKEFGQQYKSDLAASGVDVSKVTGVTAQVKKMTDVRSSLGAEQMMQLLKYYQGYTKVMDVEVKISLDGINKQETITATVVLIGRNWYML